MRRSVLYLLIVAGVALAGRNAARAGVSARSVRAATGYSRAHGGLALLVIQNGRTLGADGPVEQRLPIFSGTKAFWCLAALAAVQDGRLTLDEPASDTLTEWRADPRRRAIRVRQLLDFTCGLEPASRLHRTDRPNRDKEALALPQIAAPGRAFNYGPGQLQALDELLRRKLQRRGDANATTDFLERRVLRPLGLRDVDYRRDRAGNPLLASGFQLTAEEWARVGRLVLGGGKFGARTVLRRDLLDECFRGTAANPMFGLGFWLNREAAQPTVGARVVDVEIALDLPRSRVSWQRACLAPVAPADLVVSLGSHGQRLYVVPSLGLVVVRQGRGAGFRDAAFLEKLLAEKY